VRTLVLWDIDHTLIDAGGISRGLYGSAFLRVTGRPMDRLADMMGRTDRAIMAETLELHGIAPSEDVLRAFADELAAQFAAKEALIRENGRILPGASDALAALAAMPDVVQSALTGNMKSIAVLKLTAFDLLGFLDFEVGAFGMDDADRSVLVPLAQKRAGAKYGIGFDASTTVLVGDTPNDVRAGREGGARVVGVATGRSDAETLRRAGADAVVSDLASLASVLGAILAR
jgi:phosphoglycolate phosphatase-like HAD superfamily hydrolase